MNRIKCVFSEYHIHGFFQEHCKRSLYKYASSRQSLKDTVVIEEVEKFHRLASTCWNKNGPLAALHLMNFLRVPLVCDGLKQTGIISPHIAGGPLPLDGLHILDVGCGGGILSEALASLGASVTGIDPTAEMIQVAQDHCSRNPTISNRIMYKCSSLEDLMDTEQVKYDAIVASEVIEHIKNLDQFLLCCVELVKENGSLFFTTINKTWSSYLLAIAAAEWIMRIVPQGTHNWENFVLPSQLQMKLESNDCTVRLIHGMCYNPVTRKWSWTVNSSVNYALHATKNRHSLK